MIEEYAPKINSKTCKINIIADALSSPKVTKEFNSGITQQQYQ